MCWSLARTASSHGSVGCVWLPFVSVDSEHTLQSGRNLLWLLRLALEVGVSVELRLCTKHLAARRAGDGWRQVGGFVAVVRCVDIVAFIADTAYVTHCLISRLNPN